MVVGVDVPVVDGDIERAVGAVDVRSRVGGLTLPRERLRIERRNRSASTTVTIGRMRRGRTRRSRSRATVFNIN